jgi:hypothetical protein
MLVGRAEARLAHTLAVRAGRSAFLRLIRRLPDPATHVPGVLGMDEFALRMGHNYGGFVMERVTSIELALPAWEAMELAQVLRL